MFLKLTLVLIWIKWLVRDIMENSETTSVLTIGLTVSVKLDFVWHC